MLFPQDFGWNSGFATAFAPYEAQGLRPGRVSLQHNHVLRVMTETGERLAEVAGRLRHQAQARHELPAVGDWVALKVDDGGRYVVRAVLPRQGQFLRKVAGEGTAAQVVAANVDTVFLVSGLDGDFNPRRIERYLILARESGTQPVIVLNKADLADDVAEAVALIAGLAGDVPVHAVSAADGRGFEVLQPYLEPGRTVALLGSSGVGKSSIVNHLMGRAVLPTRSVRESDSRGRHTSVHRQLLVVPGGALIIDTPGMRELQLWGGDEGTAETFGDVTALAADCRFRDCQHGAEPGCAVKAAAADGRLAPERYEHFRKMTEERRVLERRQDERALLDEKRLGRVMGKALKAMQKSRGR